MMKKLTIKPNLTIRQVELLEETANVKFPNNFVSLLLEYSGLSVKENRFYDKENRVNSLSSFCEHRSIYDFIIEFKELNLGVKVPFAFDDGGWIYCLSFDEKNYGSVLLHQYSGLWHDESDAFEIIAGSLEEFINSLQPDDSIL